MKAIKYICAAALLALTLVSCEKDFFETDSPSAMDKSVFLSTELTQQAIGAIYNTMGEDKSFRNRLCGGYVAMNTDIEYCNKGSGQAKEAALYSLSKGTGDLSTSNGKDPWAYLNSGIERCNVVIDGIRQYSDTTDETFQYFLGEALSLRAFFYLEMIKLWGDVPACFKSFDGMNLDDLYVKKSDRNVVFDQLRIDLKEAARLMPWSDECPGAANNYVGRPSKAFAYALLARMDMMYAGLAMRPNTFTEGGTSDCSIQYNVKDASVRQELYQEVVDACYAIIQHDGDSKLEANFEDIFKKLCSDVTAYNQTEYIWCVPFLDGARGQVLCLSGLKISSNAPGHLVNTAIDASNSSNNTKVQGMIMVTPTFYFDYAADDARRDVTVCPFQWEYDNGSGVSSEAAAFPGATSSEKKLYQKLSTANSLYLGKYRVEWMNRSYLSNEDCVDMPVIRYADVLLMFAEAALGSLEGNAPSDLHGLSALEAFNKVHTRAGLAAAGSVTMDDIIKERAFEFCGENIRKYDLMRWGKLGSQLQLTKERIAALQAGEGEFAGRPDSIYFTYKEAPAYGVGCKAYVFDKFIGYHLSDARPSDFSKADGWVVKALYTKEEDQLLDPSKYTLFSGDATSVDRHQYWPIFDVNVNASNGTLWNDYDY